MQMPISQLESISINSILTKQGNDLKKKKKN